jgi:hypothetical protein
LPDGSITSAFLEMFGRPARDTGLLAERSNRLSAAQALHLLNSNHLREKLRTGPGHARDNVHGATNRATDRGVAVLDVALATSPPAMNSRWRRGCVATRKALAGFGVGADE